MHTCASVGHSQGSFSVALLQVFLRQDLSQNLELINAVRIAGQPVPVEGGGGVALLPQAWVYRGRCHCTLLFYMGSGGLNPGPH